jgi:predicted DNA-binding antitoxin AbrB/MazE fold protein
MSTERMRNLLSDDIMRPDTGAGAARVSHMLLDSAGRTLLDAAAMHEHERIRFDAAAAVHVWAEESDYDDGETAADRLKALLVGSVNPMLDGEMADDESDLTDMSREAAWDYLSALGVDEDDIDELLNDFDSATAERVREYVAAQLPDGEDAEDAAIEGFVYGPEAEASIFDASLRLDATYKKKVAIRDGKKVRINKRVAGRVRLSAAQKLALKKASRKAHRAGARMKRMKSMKRRKTGGM